MNYPAPFKNFLKTCEHENLQVELGHELKSYGSTYLEIFISITGATLAALTCYSHLTTLTTSTWT